MGKLVGKVKSGINDLSYRMKAVPGLLDAYHKKTRLRLYPGSLNIELEEVWNLPQKTIRLEKEEYGGQVSVSLVPCQIYDTKAYIVRTDKVERGEVPTHPKTTIEIVSDVGLRDKYDLKDGDIVEIVI
jgi:CTP-dependent riboflavin kinase